MSRLIVHLLVTALLLWLISYILPGIRFTGFGSALLAAVVLGIVNVLVRPILVIITLPISVVTLGLFLIVVNALMLMLTGALVPGFTVAGFGTAILGGILLGIFNLVVSSLLRQPAAA